jgi:hypothetical protein
MNPDHTVNFLDLSLSGRSIGRVKIEIFSPDMRRFFLGEGSPAQGLKHGTVRVFSNSAVAVDVGVIGQEEMVVDITTGEVKHGNRTVGKVWDDESLVVMKILSEGVRVGLEGQVMECGEY